MGTAPGTSESNDGTEPETTRILLISGSTRAGSTNTATLRTFADIAPPEITTELFTELTEIPAFVPGDQPSPAAVRRVREQLAAADAVLFCTPEYAGYIPGSLKNLLEWTVGTADLHEKPVAWISVAAPGRGEGATESLRTVLGYLGATIVDSACARMTVLGDMVGADGLVADPEVRRTLAETADKISGILGASSHEM